MELLAPITGTAMFTHTLAWRRYTRMAMHTSTVPTSMLAHKSYSRPQLATGNLANPALLQLEHFAGIVLQFRFNQLSLLTSISTDLAVVTELFIANDYTVTGLGCDTVATTGTFVPYKQLLDPPSFSASLAKATLSSSSSVPISSSSSMPFSSSSSTQDGGGSTGTASPSNPGSGLSSGTKIGIGVGVGVGVGCLLIGAVVFLLWRRYSKKNDRKLAEVSASQAPYSSPPMKSSGPPYSPPMSYNQSQHYHEGQGGPGWAPQPEYSPGGYQESGYGPREMGAQ